MQEAAAAQPAPLVRRFAATLADWLLCVLASGLFADPRAQPWAPVLVFVIEQAVFLGVFGQTPGGYVARVRCVGVASGNAVGLPRALVRSLLLSLLLPALIMDGEGRGGHDQVAGTIALAPLEQPRESPKG